MKLNYMSASIGKRAVLVLVIVSLLAVSVVVACRQADQPETVSALRDLPSAVTAGEEFEVAVTFTSPHNQFHAIGLTDIAPAGWNVTVSTTRTTPPAMAANAPQPNKAVYIWAGPYNAGTAFTAIYKVRVPSGTPPGNYTFAGFLEYSIQQYPAPSYVIAITGDSQITVVGAEPGEPEPGWVVRDLPSVVMAGEEFEVAVTFTSPHNQFHAIGLTDIAPAGWNVTVSTTYTTPPAMVANAPQPNMAVYIWAGPYNAGTAFTAMYKVRVPSGTPPGNYTFAGFLEYYIDPYPASSHIVAITGDIRVRAG